MDLSWRTRNYSNTGRTPASPAHLHSSSFGRDGRHDMFGSASRQYVRSTVSLKISTGREDRRCRLTSRHQYCISLLQPCLVARPASGQFDNPAGFLFPDGKAIALRFLVELLYNMFDFQRFESNYLNKTHHQSQYDFCFKIGQISRTKIWNLNEDFSLCTDFFDSLYILIPR